MKSSIQFTQAELSLLWVALGNRMTILRQLKRHRDDTAELDKLRDEASALRKKIFSHCDHDWHYVDNDESVDHAYWECSECYERREYEPEELADMEAEMGDES